MSKVTLILPLPPSDNHIWKQGPNGPYLSAEYRKFKKDVFKIWQDVGSPRLEGRLSGKLLVWFKTQSRNDILNRDKGLMDSLNGLLYQDDSQIDDFHVRRGEVREKGGCILVMEILDK